MVLSRGDRVTTPAGAGRIVGVARDYFSRARPRVVGWVVLLDTGNRITALQGDVRPVGR